MAAIDLKETFTISCSENKFFASGRRPVAVASIASGLCSILISSLAMAYDLHIEGSKISISDWVEYVQESESLTLVEEVSATNPATGEEISVSLPNSAQTAEGAVIRSSERDGKLVLTMKYVDEGTLELLQAITADIGGTVVGDEGEEY